MSEEALDALAQLADYADNGRAMDNARAAALMSRVAACINGLDKRMVERLELINAGELEHSNLRDRIVALEAENERLRVELQAKTTPKDIKGAR